MDDLDASKERLRALHAQTEARAQEQERQRAEGEAWAKGILLDFGDLFEPAASHALTLVPTAWHQLFRPWLTEMVADGAMEDGVKILRLYEKYNTQRVDLTYRQNAGKWDRYEVELEDRSETVPPYG